MKLDGAILGRMTQGRQAFVIVTPQLGQSKRVAGMKLIRNLKSMTKLAAGLADPRNWQTFYVALRARKLQQPAECPICGYKGKFDAAGTTMPRVNAVCPRCGSMERNRLLMLALQKERIVFEGKRILHFAPESALNRIFTLFKPSDYLSADIEPARAMRVVNIEQMDLPNNSYEVVICSHVLEHVDDQRALAEIHRVLVPGGVAVLLFPIIESWETTYDDPTCANTEEDRITHFGQGDHIRYYGRDVRERIRSSGFLLDEVVAGGLESARYALFRGETIFLAKKQ